MRSLPKSINLQPQDPNLITGTAEGGRSRRQAHIYPSINIPHARVESGCRQYMDRSRLDARGVKTYGTASGATIKHTHRLTVGSIKFNPYPRRSDE